MLSSFLWRSCGGRGGFSCCSFCSCFSLCCVILFFLACPVTVDCRVRNFEQCSSALRTKWVLTAVLRSDLRFFASFPVFKQLGSTIIGKVFIEVFIVNLNHWCINASTKTFNLIHSEKAIFRGFSFTNVSKIFNSSDYFGSLQDYERLKVWLTPRIMQGVVPQTCKWYLPTLVLLNMV